MKEKVTYEKHYRELASEDEKKHMQIKDLSLDFACRIIRLYQHLSTEREFIISKQIVRSGTSIGANVREAQRGQSKADFISKMNIALKEAAETEYWIILLRDNGMMSVNAANSLMHDCTRIIRVLNSIIFSSKKA